MNPTPCLVPTSTYLKTPDLGQITPRSTPVNHFSSLKLTSDLGSHRRSQLIGQRPSTALLLVSVCLPSKTLGLSLHRTPTFQDPLPNSTHNQQQVLQGPYNNFLRLRCGLSRNHLECIHLHMGNNNYNWDPVFTLQVLVTCASHLG